MKRFFSLFLCIIMIATCVGCTPPAEEIHSPVRFYYPKSKIDYGKENSVLDSEIREGYGKTESPIALLNLYLDGPVNADLTNPFPTGSTILSLTTTGEFVSVVISDAYASLSGLDLTIACASLAKTVIEITGVPNVMLRVDTLPLGSSRAILLNQEMILLLDNSATETQPQ